MEDQNGSIWDINSLGKTKIMTMYYNIHIYTFSMDFDPLQSITLISFHSFRWPKIVEKIYLQI